MPYQPMNSHPVFQKVLDKFYGGKKDENTLQLLKAIKELIHGSAHKLQNRRIHDNCLLINTFE